MNPTGATQSAERAATLEAPLVAVVVPTYNEAENLPELARRLFALSMPETTLLVVDDGSPDGTGDLALELSEHYGRRITLIERGAKKGLGTAYVEGFARALEAGFSFVVQMDADLSHPPEYIPQFIDALKQADVVVGSRYVRHGGVDRRWARGRRLLSASANAGIRLTAGLAVRDATSGFKAFRAEALSRLDMSRFRCKGFAFQVEVAHACQRAGFRVVEYPYLFNQRARGTSKMSPVIVLEAALRLLPLRWRR